jgi:membrane protease YdiL (CAAX protease family)
MIKRIMQAIAAPQAPPPWNIVYAVGAVIGAFAAVLIGTTIGTFFGEQTAFTVTLSWIIGMALIALYITLARNRTVADGHALAIIQPVPRALLIILLSFGVGAVLDLLSLFVTGTPSVIAEFVPLFNSPSGPAISANATTWAMMGLLLVIFQPVAEGLVFRGVAYPALRATLAPGPGFLMTAVWYGVFHLVAYSTPGAGTWATWWYTLLLPILAGLYLNGVRAYTGSTRASIFAQMGLGLFFIVRAITLVG